MWEEQIQIRKVNGVEQARLLEVLRGAAEEFKLRDNTAVALAPNTLCSLVGTKPLSCGIGARKYRGIILVDFNAGRARTKSFELLYGRVYAGLLKMFSDRLKVVYGTNCIRYKRRLPMTKKRRELIIEEIKLARSMRC